jgi:uncharacterized delta-60 repeat protein
MPRRTIVISLATVVSLLVPGSAFADPGDLDATFSDNGKTTTDFDGGGEFMSGLDVGDGRIVIAGDTSAGEVEPSDFALAAYRFDGELDPTFGGDGRVVLDVLGLGGDDVANDVVVLDSGKILVAGWTRRPEQLGSGFTLVRLRRNGTPDPTFSEDGVVRTLFTQGRSFAQTVVVRPNGRIVVGGSVVVDEVAKESDFAVARYLANGRLDDSFGVDGRMTTDLADGDDGVSDMVLQPDGKVVLVGWAARGGDYDLAAVRYRTDGFRDGTFDGDGRVIMDLDPADEDYAAGIALRGDGKVVLGAHVEFTPGGGRIGLVRLRPDGEPDPSFGGGDGIVISNPTLEGGTYVTDLALQDDGRILVGGTLEDTGENFFMVVRYRAGGGLDTGFGADGIARAAFATDSRAFGQEIAVQPNGKIVMAGREAGHGDAAVARFLP